VSRRELRGLLAIGIALAGAGAWWLRRVSQPEVVPQALSSQPVAAAAALAPRVQLPAPAPASAAPAVDEPAELASAALGADERSKLDDDAAQGELVSRAAEDRNLGQPGRPPISSSAAARAPDPPPALALDPDEVTPDDPRDFDLPAR